MIKFRGHSLVIGATGTGKGVLVAAQARKWMKAGGQVWLLANKPDEYAKFPATAKTMKQEVLLEWVQKAKAPKEGYVNTMVVIDEAWAWKWKGEGGLQMIANAARSYGVEMWVQSQFPTQMAPTVRANCQNVFCFLLTEPAALSWVEKTYGKPFDRVGELPAGRYIAKRGLEEPFFGRAWFEKDGNWVGV